MCHVNSRVGGTQWGSYLDTNFWFWGGLYRVGNGGSDFFFSASEASTAVSTGRGSIMDL